MTEQDSDGFLYHKVNKAFVYSEPEASHALNRLLITADMLTELGLLLDRVLEKMPAPLRQDALKYQVLPRRLPNGTYDGHILVSHHRVIRLTDAEGRGIHDAKMLETRIPALTENLVAFAQRALHDAGTIAHAVLQDKKPLERREKRLMQNLSEHLCDARLLLQRYGHTLSRMQKDYRETQKEIGDAEYLLARIQNFLGDAGEQVVEYHARRDPRKAGSVPAEASARDAGHRFDAGVEALTLSDFVADIAMRSYRNREDRRRDLHVVDMPEEKQERGR